jgi:hypothetical protein
MRGVRFQGGVNGMQIDFLPAEDQRLPACAKRDRLHAENPDIKCNGGVYIVNREYQVIQEVNLHGISKFVSPCTEPAGGQRDFGSFGWTVRSKPSSQTPFVWSQVRMTTRSG